MITQSNYYIFYYSTWLQITITTFGKTFSWEEMLADLAVFPDISQIKLVIRQIKFPWRNTFVTRKIKSRRIKKRKKKRKTFINFKIMVCSKTPFSKNLHHIETRQLIWKSNQLAGFYTIGVFTERYFRTDYKLPRSFSCFFYHAISPTSLYTKMLVL